jgi:hypothetical protein
LGGYQFDQEQLTKHLGIDRSAIRLHVFEGKLFLNDELLAEKIRHPDANLYDRAPYTL